MGYVREEQPHLFAVNTYAFSLNFHNATLITIVAPAALLRLDQAHHTSTLAQLAAISAFIAMLLPPLVGIWSDRLHMKGHKRRIFIALGGFINIIGLMGMFLSQALLLWIMFLLLSLVGQGTAVAGYHALWSDVIPSFYRGKAAGIQGAAILLGSITGLLCAGLIGAHNVLPLMAMMTAIGVIITLVAVPENPVPQPKAPTSKPLLSFKATIRSRRDFLYVFTAQLLVIFGMTLLMTYVLYFFEDVLHVTNPARGTASVAVFALLGSVASSIYIGRISDHFRRRNLVALSAIPMAMAAIGFSLFPQQQMLYIFAMLFGLGYGGFVSTGWALAVDALPDANNVARDLGIWGIASSLPAVIAPIFGAWILSWFTDLATGYRMLFFIAGVSMGLSGVVIMRVGTGATSSFFSMFLRLCVALLMFAWDHSMYHVRVWGRLPFKRQRSLVISNHLHELDGMVLPVWLNLHGPWRHPVYFAASQRMFEPGFLALRLHMTPFGISRLNMASFFRMVGVRPIENEPLARPYSSYAWDIYQTYGNLSLATIFTDKALHAMHIPADQPLKVLWQGQYIKRSQLKGSLSAIKQPYKAYLQSQQRQTLEQQLQQLTSELESGGTLYVTPEGGYSTDGHLKRFKQAEKQLRPYADEYYLTAISYDPFIHQKLSLFVKIKSVVSEVPITTQLCAARPITASQLIAKSLPSQPHTAFCLASIQKHVNTQKQQLPQDALLIPELQRATDKAVANSLKHMAQKGILIKTDTAYHLSDHRQLTSFPHVPDILTYQQNMLHDTLTALKTCRQHHTDDRTTSS